LNDDKSKSMHAPAGLLNDGKSNVPLCAGSSAENAKDTDEDISNDDCEHALPDIETEGNQRGTCRPATNVEASSYDPEPDELQRAVGSAFRREGKSVLVAVTLVAVGGRFHPEGLKETHDGGDGTMRKMVEMT
jgi:hypothetical protein